DQLVKAAKADDREAATVSIVKAAVGINPAAAPAIVGAIAKAVPDVAALAAGTAAAEQPAQAGAIVRAATAAAPSKLRKIVAALCKAVPNQYRNIAVAASQTVPGHDKEILETVTTTLPDLKPQVEKALAGYNGNVPSVAITLDQAAKPAPTVLTQPSRPAAPTLSSAVMPRGARGPAVGPPYIPLSGTPTNVNPGNSGDVPPGGRNYAAP